MSVTVVEGVACIWAVWGFIVFLVQAIGSYQIFRYHSSPPKEPVSPSLPPDHVPHVTVIRPVRGLEPELYECLASAFRQSYPRDKLSIHICVASRDDPAYPTLLRVVADFPQHDARVYVEAEDPVLHGTAGSADNLGPNPKIRNISRAYREARGDIVWVLDCNVWVAKGVAGRMVDKLCGYRPGGRRAAPYKFVHQLPLVVDMAAEAQSLLSPASASGTAPPPAGTPVGPPSRLSYVRTHGGGRLEEMFMATTHAKFYSAINTVGIAPCVVGKSNMFRRSHLDRVTDASQNAVLSPADAARGRGVDFFSSYICEDHLIGDLLWRSSIPGFPRHHGLVAGDLAVQPMAGMSVAAYVARRVRWLRVRKWTVLAATLVEPGVESLLCCAYLSFALTTAPLLRGALGLPPTWRAMAACWGLAVAAWMAVDRAVYRRLHACRSVAADADTPAFARGAGRVGGVAPKPLGEWALAWLGREVLALPVWTWAVLLGATVTWRGQRFTVRMDMSVVQGGGGNDGEGKGKGNGVVKGTTTTGEQANRDAHASSRSGNKDRID